MQACFVFETSPTLRKMWPFTRFWRKLIVISLLLEIFARLNAISIALYMPNIMHAVFVVETSPSVRNMRTYTRHCRKGSVISLLLEIFRRLNAISIAFYTPIATHAAFSVETITSVRKVRPFTPLWRKLSVISILLGKFRRLNAMSIAFYTPDAMHANFIVDKCRPCEECDNFLDFEEKCSLYSSCWRYFDV